VSLKDVAAVAGTSVATASRGLSGAGPVAEGTRRAILAAARTLNYYPDLRARGLRKQSTRSIGLIIPNLLDVYFIALADTLSQLLAERKYHFLIASTRDDPDSEREMLYQMTGQVVDGLIWVPTAPSHELLDYLSSQRVCSVSIVRRVPGDRMDTVVARDLDGSLLATQHLINLGHRRIGFVGGETKYSDHYARWRGYQAAMQAAGLVVDETLVKLGPDRSTWGIAALGDLLRLPVPPTAIFVGSNAIMAGVIRAVRARGVPVPDVLSLICFDDVDWFSFSTPPITAVEFSHARLAEVALDVLFARIDRPDEVDRPPVFIEIECDLILRSSTAPCRQL
jgi:LacI family transcriptional regulator